MMQRAHTHAHVHARTPAHTHAHTTLSQVQAASYFIYNSILLSDAKVEGG